MSGSGMNSMRFSGLAEPPYRMRTRMAAGWPNRAPTVARIDRVTSLAASGVGVSPVPMAQMGS